MKRVPKVFLIMVIVLSLITTGCAGKASNKPPIVTASPTASGKAPNAGYITITDFRGKTVKVKEPVTRIVATYGLAAQMVYLLGAGGKIVGGTRLVLHDNFIKLIDPEAKNRIVFAGNPKSANVEEIKKLNTDVVFTSAWGDERLDEQFEGLGIPVVALNLETVDNYLKSLEIMGRVLGKEEKATEIGKYYKTTLEKVTKVTSKLNNNEKPKVLLIEYSLKRKAFKVPGSDYFQNGLIEMSGGESVSKDLPGGWNVVNTEQVARWNPDVIIVVSYSQKYSSASVKSDILNDSSWRQLKAIKDGKIYAMPNDGESWDYPAPKWILGLYWTAKVLHPDHFKEMDTKEEANEFYKRFFNTDISKVKIVGDWN